MLLEGGLTHLVLLIISKDQFYHVIVGNRGMLSREEASKLLDDSLLPKAEYGNRHTLSRDAQGVPEGRLILGSDPVLALTYGEFPHASLDELLDFACRHLPSKNEKYLNVVDLGSGYGRLCLYMALTRRNWRVTGIEISDILHREATATMQKCEKEGWLVPHGEATLQQYDDRSSALSLLQGPAEAHRDVLCQADLIFAYSTAFDASGFSEVTGTMILSEEWNQLLSATCQEGCVVVTTDRALDPFFCWKRLGRLDVDNPEVGGSVGYIQQLVKDTTL